MGLRRMVAAFAASLALLAGCGGGGGGTAAAPPEGITIDGVAATGAPLAGAAIRLTDSKGTVVATATAAADGSYTLDVPAGAVAPFVASAARDGVLLFSPVAAGGRQRVNITPLTHVAAAQLSPTGDPAALAAQLQAGTATISTEKVKQVVAALLQALQPLLANAGSAGVDPIAGVFAADGTGHDRLLASISVAVTPGDSQAGTISITVRGLPAGADEAPSITFAAGDTPPVLPDSAAEAVLPAANVDALVAGWTARAQACWALPRAQRVTGTKPSDTVAAPACRGLFWNDDPASYRHNGFAVGAQAAFSSLFVDGATGLAFDAGRLEATEAGGSLLVSWRERVPGGNVVWSRTVFKVQDGSLKAVGNQGTYSFSVHPSATRREYLADGSFDHVFSGYSVNVANFTGGQASLFDRVVVTMPGGRRLTLRPVASLSFLVLERPDGTLAGSSNLRLAGRYLSAATGGSPHRLAEPQYWLRPPSGQDTVWSDTDIAALPEFARWKAEFFLAGNAGATPDAVQHATVTARPLRPSDLLARSWATLTPAYRDSLATAVAGGGLQAGGTLFQAVAPGGGDAWQVPSDAQAPLQLQVFGFEDVAGLPRFNDFANPGTTARSGSVVCTPQVLADTHCSGAVYAASARIDGLQIAGTDARERDFATFFSLAPAPRAGMQ